MITITIAFQITFMCVKKFDVESVLPIINDAQCLHLALTFPVVSGGILKLFKTGAAISN